MVPGAGTGPSTFSPVSGSPIPSNCPAFCPINYSARFYDFDASGTIVKSWTWKIELYHSRGTYVLPLANPTSSAPAYSDLQITNTFTLPTGYDWFRNANGDILAKVQVVGIDSDTFHHHTEQLVGINYPPGKTTGTIVCKNGTPLANTSVTVELWDATGNLATQTTTTNAAGRFEVGILCSSANHANERFMISCPNCSRWMIRTDRCFGELGPLVCNQCGGCIAAPSGLAGWWTFDEKSGNVAADLSGIANQASLSNGPTPTNGKVAGAMCFDGQDDFATVPDHPEINFLGNCDALSSSVNVSRNTVSAESFTIDTWLKTTATGQQVILDKREKQGLNFLKGYSLYLQNGRLGFQMATGPGHFLCNYPNAACSSYLSPTNVHLNDGKWHFIAVTISRCGGAVGRIYIDGKLVQTFAPRSGDISNQLPLLIGRGHPLPAATYFAGCLDELEIVKRVLSKAELDVIYEAGSSGKCKPAGPFMPDRRKRN